MPVILLLAQLTQIAIRVTPQVALAPAVVQVTVLALTVKVDQLCVVVSDGIPTFSCWPAQHSRSMVITLHEAGVYAVWAAAKLPSGLYVHSTPARVRIK